MILLPLIFAQIYFLDPTSELSLPRTERPSYRTQAGRKAGNPQKLVQWGFGTVFMMVLDFVFLSTMQGGRAKRFIACGRLFVRSFSFGVFDLYGSSVSRSSDRSPKNGHPRSTPANLEVTRGQLVEIFKVKGRDRSFYIVQGCCLR